MVTRVLRAGMWVGIALVGVVLLIVAAPRMVGGHSYSVLSDSMRGSVNVGDQVIVTPISAADIEVGQIVAFEDASRDGMLLQHRVIEVKHSERGATVTTRGDANTASETWGIPLEESVGEVVFVIPKLGYALGQTGESWVRIALVLVGFAAVATLCIAAIWNGRGRRLAAGVAVGWLLVIGIGGASTGGIGGALSETTVNGGNQFSAAESFDGG